jgi:hypothetical protein
VSTENQSLGELNVCNILSRKEKQNATGRWKGIGVSGVRTDKKVVFGVK